MHKTHHFDIRNRKIFRRGGTAPSTDLTTSAPSVPLSDGLDTRPCKILDQPLIPH